MKHYGDITKINGHDVPIVDIVTGGSPCQDLSVAGKRVGLAGERSGLFMEQIRLIKEIREHDRANHGADVDIRLLRPRFMVWENVPGAFSSNGGADFQAVLEETAKVAEGSASIPRLEKWPPSGCIMGDGWSVAWRVHDAQFWGVPQRRKRIALVADFGGQTAPEILFERKGLSGDTETGGTAWKKAAGDSGESVEKAISFQERAGKPGGGKGILIQNERTGALSTLNNQSVCCLNDQGGSVMDVSEDVSGTLRAQEHGHQPCVMSFNSKQMGLDVADNISNTLLANDYKEPQSVVYGISAYESNSMKSDNPHSGIYEAETARTLDLNGGSPACNQGGMAVVCVENHPNDSRVKIRDDGMCQTLSGRMGTGGGNVPLVMEAINGEIAGTLDASYYKGCGERQGIEREVVCIGNGQMEQTKISEKVGALNCMHDQQAVMVSAVDCRNGIESTDINGTLQAKENGGISYNCNNVLRVNSIVRRLTPLECERLQGFPDGWTDIGEWTDSKGKKHKDAYSPRYKALGNSIALPFWSWMAKRMAKYIDHKPTMASLFDGIGGFPLAYSRAGCKPVWASEIEEFPIAVTKIRFPEEEI